MSTQELAIPRKLWEHPDPQSTYMWKFKQSVEKQYGLNLPVSRSSIKQLSATTCRMTTDLPPIHDRIMMLCTSFP